uniref:Arrestin-like N-terminal domain-containing protein n=1 Tax=Panagrolaimus sp. ES5 TaxID=591445 RepID=A0AC34G265_9BILA
MSSYISIQLDNPSKSYYPDTNVTGKVAVFLTKPKKVKNITLHAFGQAKTSFHYQSVLPCGSEKKIFEHYFILWNPKNGDSELIPAGKQYFKFTFQIPSDCLPYFEGEYGSIRYSIKAKIDISLQFKLKDEQLFSVNSVLPTTVAQKLVKQNFTHKFSASEIINVEVILPNKHFAFGETVKLVANIENQSNVTIDSIETGIQTTISYKGKATDSWRGKYFEANEIDNIDFLARKNKLYVNFCKTLLLYGLKNLG